jgi:hypothetical protein
LIFCDEETDPYATDEELYGSYAEVGRQAKTITMAQVEAELATLVEGPRRSWWQHA